jgi:peroxiredoxin
MKHTCNLTWIILTALVIPAFAQDTTNTDLTELGQRVPEFTVRTTDGKTFHSRKLDDRVVLINFFATWCDPCIVEMPHLEKEIWQKFKDERFTVLCIGREHTMDEVAAFKKEKNLSLPMAPDPDREIYKKFATMYIPRNYIIDSHGRIVYQAKGYTEEGLARIIHKIQELLQE